MTWTGLEGNGVALVRERALAAAVQRALERLYQLDRVADVDAYLAPAGDGEREALLVHEADDGALELSLRVPELGCREIDVTGSGDLDPVCQLIEGVSHFVYLTDRAARARGTTQLEMELQAEVDKYLVIVASLPASSGREGERVRARLFGEVTYVHAATTELGARYRLATELAHRFTARLEREFVSRRRFGELHAELRRFFRMGQEDKLRVARG